MPNKRLINGKTKYGIKNNSGIKLTNYMEYMQFDLVKIMENWYNKITLSKLEKYLLYLLMSRKSDEEVTKFIKGDDILMQTEKVRQNVKHETILLDYDVEAENEAYIAMIKDDAKNEIKNENARKMKENGIADDLIAKITGLSKKQISML